MNPRVGLSLNVRGRDDICVERDVVVSRVGGKGGLSETPGESSIGGRHQNVGR